VIETTRWQIRERLETLGRRAGVRSTVLVVVITLALVGMAVGGWRLYTGWWLGRIELYTDDGPVVAQVLAELSDQPIGEPFDLHSRAMVSLPAGEYRLRVTGLGRLSRMYRFAVNRGETLAHTISIDEGRLLGGERAPVEYRGQSRRVEPIRFAARVMALELTPGKSDLIAWSEESMICRDGATGAVRWDQSRPAQPFSKGHDPSRWLRLLHRGELAEPAADFDGDGTLDLIAYFPKAAVLLAISGKDGSILWSYIAQTDGPGGPREGDPERNDIEKEWGLTAGKPAMADVDRDGVPDLFVTFVFPGWSKKNAKPAAAPESMEGGENVRRRCSVVAISGRTGQSLWTHPIDQDFAGDPEYAHVEPAALVRGKQSTLIGFVDNTKWLGLDFATGVMKAGPVELGFVPLRPVQHADLDGDGEPDLVAVGPTASLGHEILHAFSSKTGHELWTEEVSAPCDPAEEGALRPQLPLITDLDDDGKPEIVVPDGGPMPPLAGYRGIRLIDGRTGATRWRRAMRPETKSDDGLASAVVGPDLDGDGTRELFTVSLVEPGVTSTMAQRAGEFFVRVYVDALSGKDGRPLWWWSADLPPGEYSYLWTPLWWGRGPDGWPLLAVRLGGVEDDESRAGFGGSSLAGSPVVHVLEASTGRERHVIEGLAQVSVNDLDGDGLSDLWGEVDGELRAFRGEAPERWRALGRFEPAAARVRQREAVAGSWVDLDGDQIADALLGDSGELWNERDDSTGTQTAVARSGRDGHLIWKTELDRWEHWLDPSRKDTYDLEAIASPRGDFDGDGTPDVIVHRHSDTGAPVGRAATLGVQVLSGRTGARLWSAGALPRPAARIGEIYGQWIQSQTIERNGAPDLFVGYWEVFTRPVAGSRVAPSGGSARLARVSGRDGRVLWDVEIPASASQGSYALGAPRTFFDDFDGDGALDLVMDGDGTRSLVMTAPGAYQSGELKYALTAFSLRDGRQIWSRVVRANNSVHESSVDELDGPDRPALVVMDESGTDGGVELAVRALDGRDGQARWTTKTDTAIDSGQVSPEIVSANFEGGGLHQVCVGFNLPGGRRIMVLDANGNERARRDLKELGNRALHAVDSNGDGRDELFTFSRGRLLAMNGDLKDLWSWPTSSSSIDAIVRGSAGGPCEVVVSPALALDGATGRPRWTGQRSLTQSAEQTPQFEPELLDLGDSKRLPLLIASGLGATVCREALRTDGRGTIAEARGTVMKPGAVSGDPRWLRPLPWVVRLRGPLGPWGFLTAGGLAFINLFLPLMILRLARGGRRSFSMRGLMLLPAVAAIPLMVLLTVVPWLPLGSNRFLGTEIRLFATGTLAGSPIALCAVWLCRSLVRLRLLPVVALAGLTVAATLAVAGSWLWLDMKSMASIEHYEWAGWERAILAGAYVAAVLWVIGRVIVGGYRLIRRLGGVGVGGALGD
jgi:hypothetical protein